MASATMEQQDESLSPMTRSRNASPHQRSSSEGRDAIASKGDGYTPTPLRGSRRVNSVNDREWPAVPQKEPERPATVGGGLRSGSSGPAPFTEGQQNGYVKKEKRVAPPTPTERRSVQFARGAGDFEAPPLARSGTKDTDDGAETPGKERQAGFFGKLKAFAGSSSTHVRSASTNTGQATPNAALSPQSERSEPVYPTEAVEGIEADADVSESSEDADRPSGSQPRKRRKSRRPPISTQDSAPTQPRMSRLESRFASFLRDQATTGGVALSHSNTITEEDHDEEARAGVSEDEGRARVRARWRRGLESARGLSHSARKQNETESPDVSRRPGHFRRLTHLGGGLDGQSPGSPSQMVRAKPDRQTTTSAQKWRQVKQGIKMLGQRRREEKMRVDHQKSAQLMAELLAGAPAALVLASMYQRDENNHRKIPVLLEQLKIRIPDSQIRHDAEGDRHLVFRIDLEYGNGPARMRWSISRSLQDFVNLHLKYQAAGAKDKLRHLKGGDKGKAKMPRFPRSAFPFARNWRGLFDSVQNDDDDEEEGTHPPPTPNGIDIIPPTPNTLGPMTPGAATPGPTPGFGATPGSGGHSRPDGPAKHKRRKSSFAPIHPPRTSTNDLSQNPTDSDELDARQRDMYAKRQRRKLDTYLQQMIRWLIFRPDSTRLCKFLELSSLAIRLSVEGGYQGKQGLLTIASRRNRELRRKPLGPGALADRHKPRWFLVRHSYIVCVDGPESLNPYDVFLVDSDFTTEKGKKSMSNSKSPHDVAKVVVESAPKGKHFLIRLYNSERKLKLLARTERQYLQFQESINTMAAGTIWSKKQRFASYAPVRNNVWCRWLVDARDHMWQVSRAIDNAKDFIYIHDWWLSPELYLRRPAAISQKWRLDRLLQRKAQEGVKIFVVVYRNIESAIPIDSEYTKWSLLDLHENICIQRSPNQFRQNQFFWAHHEKLVVVDNMMAFVGGVDLCFGRWDEPCHSLTDDKLTGFELNHEGPRDSEHCQVWPGKDYSNPRVQDFYALDRPYEEMYDRTKVPRMPWHDISMQLVGQPARDVGRHFVQRWNYILRSRIPSRPTPVLIPPPEFESSELEHLGMTGTCQVQILRSCASWSIGTPNKIEHSIMNAYVHLIEHSKHFVYIENQFYISSCTVEGTTIHNKIGDALVERIIRAHENEENWQACLIIPLMPGFQNSVDSQDGTSVRLIMQCQYRSICRGDTSIFGRLKAHGIDPEDYIRFYSLRQWGKIGPRKCLTTEQLYIHAKCMVVDDRSVIIGSANINERSMLGSRDSEVAAVVTDTKLLPSTMGGEPFEVGEFPHTLRKRLMREHLGIDVDGIYRREQVARERAEQDAEMARIYREEQEPEDYFSSPRRSAPFVAPPVIPANAAHSTEPQRKPLDVRAEQRDNVVNVTLPSNSSSSSDPSNQDETCKKPQAIHKDRHLDVEGFGEDNMRALQEAGDEGLTDSYIDPHGHEVLLKKDVPGTQRIQSLEDRELRRSSAQEQQPTGDSALNPPFPLDRTNTTSLGLMPRSRLPELPPVDDTDIGGPALIRGMSHASARVINPLINSLKRPEITEDCMADPLASTFFHDIWNQVAENNTKIYRQVFRCMPDSEVVDWRTYERFNHYNELFMQSQGLGTSTVRPPKDAPERSGPPGSGDADEASVVSTAKEAAATRPRSRTMLGGLVDKLRPGSRTSDDTATNPNSQPDEKDETEFARDGSPGTPVTDGPTAVPSPHSNPANEKESQKLTGDADNKLASAPAETFDEKQDLKQPDDDGSKANLSPQKGEEGDLERRRTVQYSDRVTLSAEPITVSQATSPTNDSTGPSLQPGSGSQKRRRRAGTKNSARHVPDEVLSKDDAEELLKLVQGRVVCWPYDWLEKEERGGNWLYNIDQLAPLEIYD